MKNIHTSYALISNDKWITNFSQCWLWLVPTVNCQQDISRLARFFIIIRTPIFIRLSSMGLDLVTAACRLLLCPSAPLFDLRCPCFCCCLFAPHHNPLIKHFSPLPATAWLSLAWKPFYFVVFPRFFQGFVFLFCFGFKVFVLLNFFAEQAFACWLLICTPQLPWPPRNAAAAINYSADIMALPSPLPQLR